MTRARHASRAQFSRITYTRRLCFAAVVALVAASAAVTLVSSSAPSTTTTTTTQPPDDPRQPMPTTPPAGYQQVFADDFTGTALGSAWYPYSGINEGTYDRVSGTTWDPSHVTVGNGLLTLRTYQDPAHAQPYSPWVEGGVSLNVGTRPTYGTWLVRSRVTDAIGVTQVELLWPDAANTWPPEVDFNESFGTNASHATEIYNQSDPEGTQISSANARVDLTQWHTWGVTVTPTTITYTVDGNVWKTMPNDGVNIPMHLALQQMLWPADDPWESATGPVAPVTEVDMQIDWVVVYSPLS